MNPDAIWGELIDTGEPSEHSRHMRELIDTSDPAEHSYQNRLPSRPKS